MYVIYVKLSKIIYINGNHFYDFQSINAIVKSETLMLGYKPNSQNTVPHYNGNVAERNIIICVY